MDGESDPNLAGRISQTAPALFRTLGLLDTKATPPNARWHSNPGGAHPGSRQLEVDVSDGPCAIVTATVDPNTDAEIGAPRLPLV